jgi:hypothetical protein
MYRFENSFSLDTPFRGEVGEEGKKEGRRKGRE